MDANEFYEKAGELIYKKKINSPCNKVYRRSYIEKFHIRFPVDLSIGEDTFFNLQYIIRCCSVYSCDKVLYVVNTENENSLSRGIRADLKNQLKRLDDATNLLIEKAEIASEYRHRILDALNFGLVGSVYSDTKRMHITGKSMRERHTMIRSRCKEINEMELSLPESRYCRLLAIPVRLRLVAVIDALAWYLANK